MKTELPPIPKGFHKAFEGRPYNYLHSLPELDPREAPVLRRPLRQSIRQWKVAFAWVAVIAGVVSLISSNTIQDGFRQTSSRQFQEITRPVITGYYHAVSSRYPRY